MDREQITGRALYQTGVIRGVDKAIRLAQQVHDQGGSVSDLLAMLKALEAVEDSVGWNLHWLDH